MSNVMSEDLAFAAALIGMTAAGLLLAAIVAILIRRPRTPAFPRKTAPATVVGGGAHDTTEKRAMSAPSEDVNRSDWQILVILEEVTNPPGALSVAGIQPWTDDGNEQPLEASDVFDRLTELQSWGWVQPSTQHGQDAGGWHITDEGRAALTAARRYRQQGSPWPWYARPSGPKT